MDQTPVAEPNEPRCPSCGYTIGTGGQRVRCPECGVSLSHWAKRWHPGHALAGLDCLAWGLPLTMVGFVLAGVRRLIQSPREPWVVMDPLTQALCVVPCLVCLAGAIQLQIAARQRWRVASILAATMLLGIMVAAIYSAQRTWAGKTGDGSFFFFTSTRESVGTLGFALAALCGTWVAFLAAKRVRDLGREGGVCLNGLPTTVLVALTLAVLAPFGHDLFRFFMFDAKTRFGGDPTMRTSIQGAGVLDNYALIATGMVLALLWCSVTLVRARIRWDARAIAKSC